MLFWNAIMKLTWFIFVQGPLNLIAAFTKVLEYLTGGIINDLLFGSSKDFKWNNIPAQFWWFVVVAICLFSLVFTIQMIILMFKESTETKTKFVLAIQNGAKAFCFMFLIPIFFFLANFIMQNLANTVINNFGNDSNISQYLWHIGDSTWDGSASGVPSDFSYPSNINDYNMIAQIFGTWFMLFAIFMIGIILIQKIIELFFLFVISPIVMIVMVVDEGKAAFQWKDMVGAKFLASTATLIGYYIFISVTQVLLSSDLQGLDASDFSKSLFLILFLCGGALATMAFSDMVAHFIGEGAGIKEGMSSMRSTLAGGMMAMGAAKVAGKAMGFMKSKRSKRSKRKNHLNQTGVNSAADSMASVLQDSEKGQGLNFSSFRNANSGLASRSGIVGLAGLALGAASIGYSSFKGATKAAGLKAGFKELASTSIKPLRKIGEALNPKLKDFTRKKTEDHMNKRWVKENDKTNMKLENKNDWLAIVDKGNKKEFKKAQRGASKAQKYQEKLLEKQKKHNISDSKKNKN